jgi:hypothetical protein
MRPVNGLNCREPRKSYRIATDLFLGPADHG